MKYLAVEHSQDVVSIWVQPIAGEFSHYKVTSMDAIDESEGDIVETRKGPLRGIASDSTKEQQGDGISRSLHERFPC